NYPEFSAIKPLPLFSSARGTHLRLRPANNTVYDDLNSLVDLSNSSSRPSHLA
ncbi:hypothetical protein L9F63_015086, partial [Diploptera punctata]